MTADSPAARSLARGCDWLAAQIDDRGAISGSDQAVVYYKSPAILALAGRLDAAVRCLGHLERNFLGPRGELAIPADQEKANPFNAYDRGWVCWGALLCGRYDLAFRLAADLRAFQDAATGGFWDSRAARDAGRGRQHAMSAGMAGLALLATRHVDAAEAAARCIARVLELQPAPVEGLFFGLDVAPGGVKLREEKTPIDYLDNRGLKQRPGRLGPILVLLARPIGSPASEPGSRRPAGTSARCCRQGRAPTSASRATSSSGAWPRWTSSSRDPTARPAAPRQRRSSPISSKSSSRTASGTPTPASPTPRRSSRFSGASTRPAT
jgi:hypothetical protein